MLANHEGRNQLTQLLRQALNIPTGQLPVGTPFVETILNHEFADVPVVPRGHDDAAAGGLIGFGDQRKSPTRSNLRGGLFLFGA